MPVLFAAGSRSLRVLFWSSLALITVLSLLPSPGQAMLFPGQDKLLHGGAYLYLYSLGWLAWRRPQAWNHRLFWGLVGYGIVVELLQWLTGYRDAEWLDLAANVAGLGVGVAAVVCYRRKYR